MRTDHWIDHGLHLFWIVIYNFFIIKIQIIMQINVILSIMYIIDNILNNIYYSNIDNGLKIIHSSVKPLTCHRTPKDNTKKCSSFCLMNI